MNDRIQMSRTIINKLPILLIFLYVIVGSSHRYNLGELNLTDTTRTIENTILLSVSNSVYLRIQEISGEKKQFKNPALIINGDSIGVEELKTRGKTTLHLRRKSFSFNLNEEASLNHYGHITQFEKFYALSLSMDKHYIRNRISFGMMKEIGIFDLFYSYSELKINGQTEGIYLLTERPQDWALKKRNSPCIIRRGFDHKIDKIRSGKKIAKTETENFKQQFKQIYKALKKFQGEELYTVLSQWIDLEMYMKWLAINFFIRNGDYTDEVYFYIDPETGNYNIIPWDYDDIFAHQPHEGTEAKIRTVGYKLIFSSEDLLDQKIATDEYLYKEYLEKLTDILNILTPDKIQEILENTFSEIYPYYKCEEIISMSRFDTFKNVSIESLKSNLHRINFRLNQQRMHCISYLDKKSKNTAH
jgi:spore coat protein H